MFATRPHHWFCLLAAIALETGGTLTMKLAQGWSFAHAPALGLTVMWLAIGLSYIFLSRAVAGIPVGVTFAFWEGLGLTGITLGSVFFLDESLTPRQMLGLVCVLAGALLVNAGTGHGPQTGSTAPATVNLLDGARPANPDAAPWAAGPECGNATRGGGG